jgi:peptidoglycan/xylan/chitin deacetylase (PgdA/CDA1 family)
MKRTPIVAAVLVVAAALGFAAYEITESPGSQAFGATLVRGPAADRVVALTFDDGPNPPYTDAILRVLREERVHATFFVVGRAAAAYPRVLREEHDDGNAIGNHSWDHGHLIAMTPLALAQSLERTDAAVYAATGEHTHLMRPPFGARDWLVLSEARRLGYVPVMWSVPLARDWEYPPASVIASRILGRVSNGSIVVLHDGNRGRLCAARNLPSRVCDRSADIAATKQIVETLKARGYRFVTIPQLLQLDRATRTAYRAAE